MKKSSALKALLNKKEMAFLMEAHNAMSAKIAEQSGFEGLWASGLSISASMGLSDRNEASWTQVMDVVDFMVDNTAIPILLDGDTGFGNFNNVRRLVKKLSQRGVAGVCLEDKLFPKVNSFIGAGQDLADINEFCGKIQAAKDSQLEEDFCVVARVEALISGCPMDEALKRADAYHRAGADAILIHSKKSDGEEILSFCRQWNNACPVVIVPTKYYNTETDAFRDVGVSTVIWANHSLRASIAAMRDITQKIRLNNSVAHIEREIATLDDVFQLTNEYEVQQAEKKYLSI
ncbi:phosphoenolpyruvate mutase [Erwinia sp. PK3-005]|uniref:phosphoenolpyruvate mutase n=1 Tax=Mixta hanseatica TaxID=2872648 RepID=A0ABY4RBH2_9GAMM|nr:phosphoenolpyruvate mutase [Mixta hanseatica]UQY44050.1 phosphoenolpyruvate mutase [Mixta hanseatica]